MSRLFAGVDLGGTSIKAAVADEAGRILAHDAVPTESHMGPQAVINRIATLLRQLAAEVTGDGSSPIGGIGLGVPGLVDVTTGTTKFLPNLPTKWREVPVAALLHDQFKCPVKILNDVRTATLGELRFGHGQGHPKITLAFFSIGTGIGGGVAIDGQLRLGPMGAAGELGHQTILPGGPRCGCGNHGCLEALASGPAIAAEGIRLMAMGLAPKLREIVAGETSRVTTREMAAAAENDEAIHEAIIQAANYIGIAAANVVTVLHPDLVVLGGGVAELGEILLTPVRQVIRDRVGMFPTDGVRVERSLLGDQAGLVGAIALSLDTHLALDTERGANT